MAKGVKKIPNVPKTDGLWENLEPKNNGGSVDNHTHNDTHNDTHNHKHTPTPTPTPKVRERKTFRAQILTYPSLIERLDEYARLNGLSRAEAFERAVSDFLERNT